jgi:hypothetical protein
LVDAAELLVLAAEQHQPSFERWAAAGLLATRSRIPTSPSTTPKLSSLCPVAFGSPGGAAAAALVAPLSSGERRPKTRLQVLEMLSGWRIGPIRTPMCRQPPVRPSSRKLTSSASRAGPWPAPCSRRVFGGGLENQKASIVATDGTVTDGPYPEAIGGLCVVDVPSRAEALKWAAKTAVACRCAQEVREFMPDPTVGN